MGVMQKTAEIGILKALGASSRLVSRIFVQQGLVVGVIGIVGGCLLGYGVCFLQVGFGIIPLPSDIFFLDTLPMEIQPLDFLAVVAVAFVLCLASTLYPARKAADLVPIEALRSV
jgi:lipoprotein-releasing system permease protein